MAITQDELQSIVSAVLSAIRTNSRTIDQLTPVTSLSDGDSFEINGGKRVTYKVLRDLIASLSSTEQDSLRTLINKCELKSVSISVAESTATLTISSIGKTISTSIPVATTSSSGLMTAADKVKLQSAYDTAQTAKDTANSAKSQAESAQSGVNTINNKIGVAGGIAPIDKNGKIPSRYIPDAMDNVKEFSGNAANISFAMASAAKSSTDEGCIVYYDTATKRFLLQVSTKNDSGIITARTFYGNWLDANLFGEGTAQGRKPVAGKIYVHTSSNKSYYWNGSDLVAIGSDLALGHTSGTAFPGDEGLQLQKDIDVVKNRLLDAENQIDHIGILPCDGSWDGNGSEPRYGVWLCPNGDGGVYFRSFGSTDFYGNAVEKYNSDIYANEAYLYRKDDGIYRINNNKLESISGSSLGN